MKHSILTRLVFCAGCLLASPGVEAAILTVTNNNDSGAGSLRQAVLDADPGDVIVFNGDHTIVLASELPDIDFRLTIDGEANTVVIRGNATTRSGFELQNGADLTLINLELEDGSPGSSSVGGGAIDAFVSDPVDGRYQATLTIDGCTFRDNTSQSTASNGAWDGGAIYAARARITIRDSLFEGNVASDNTLDNEGGAIYLRGGQLTIERTRFEDNEADEGGAIWMNGEGSDSPGLLEITDSTFFGNSSRLALANDFSSEGGGAIRVGPGVESVLIRSSLFEQNDTMARGGAIRIVRREWASLAHVENSTFYDNHAQDRGGAIYADRTALEHVTVTRNTTARNAGGVHLSDYSAVRNSIIAGNAFDADGVGFPTGPDDDCAAFATDFENTLVETLAASTNTCVLPVSAGNLVGADPDFGSFSPQNNGGETETFALNPASPAIGAGNPATCRAVDQRGYVRTGPGCDLGAYEVAIAHRCATWDGTAQRSSFGGEALRLALSANTGSDIKIAGRCEGTTNVGDVIGGAGDEIVAAYVDQSIALEGGHRAFDWSLPPDGSRHPTSIDALGTGRVVIVAPNKTVALRHLELRNGVTSTATSGTDGQGGGVYAGAMSDLTLDHVRVRDSVANSGGGITADGASLTLTYSTVRDNFAANRGGGLNTRSGVVTDVEASVFHDNHAEANGGAIHVTGGSGALDIANSTLSGNRAVFGAGLRLDGTTTATANNVTIAANESTTAAASAAGVSLVGDLTITNSILSDGVGGDDCRILTGGSLAATFTLIEDGSCGITAGVDGNAVGDPGLFVLHPHVDEYREKDPKTWVHRITASGPAQNTGSTGSCEPEDQRGYPRTDGACDMGAFEIEPAPIPPTITFSAPSVAEGDSGLAEMTFEVTRTSSDYFSGVPLVRNGGSASSFEFYAPLGVYFPPGSTSETMIVQVIGDLLVEPDKTVLFQSSLGGGNAHNATVVGFPAIGTIVDNDGCPATLDLDGVTINADQDFSSPGTITATDVSVEAVVGFFSATSVALDDGFQVTAGGELEVTVDPGVCP